MDSLVGRHEEAVDSLLLTPEGATPSDTTTVLTGFLVLLFAIPSPLVVGALGGAGTPAQLAGMGLFAWWLFTRVTTSQAPARAPIRLALLIFGAAVVASYIAATIRPIAAVELRSADRALLSVCAWYGITFVSNDWISSRQRLEVLLERLVAAGGLLAAFGIFQFVTARTWVNLLQIPGLTVNGEIFASTRGGFTRPAGTAAHPIEFGVVLAMILPLAIHFAVNDRRRGPIRRWLIVAAVAFAIPISISRSAILSCAVVLLVLLPTWPRKQRRLAYGCLIMFVGAVYVAIPGLLGTFRSLFLGIGQDSSALSRTDSYTLAGQFIERAPIFGRGFGTFLPSYRILDNQYLGTLIDMGVVGLFAVLGMFVTGILVARGIRRRSSDEQTRQLAQSLFAAIAACAVGFVTFDAFSFPMCMGVVFLLLGCTGALRRIEAESSAPGTTSPESALLMVGA